jgi:hypothetical protein
MPEYDDLGDARSDSCDPAALVPRQNLLPVLAGRRRVAGCTPVHVGVEQTPEDREIGRLKSDLDLLRKARNGFWLLSHRHSVALIAPCRREPNPGLSASRWVLPCWHDELLTSRDAHCCCSTVTRARLVGVELTLLYFDGCPNWRDAEQNVRAALAELGETEVVLRRQLVDTVEEAERVGFLGSPTILVNGADPFAVPGATPGLSCRVYRTETGVSGTPTVAQLSGGARRRRIAGQRPAWRF